MSRFQQARQSRHLPSCLLDGQLNVSAFETPLVTRPSLLAIAIGGGESIAKAERRTVRFSGNAPCRLTYSETKENSLVGNQKRIAGSALATATILSRWARLWMSPLSWNRKKPDVSRPPIAVAMSCTQVLDFSFRKRLSMAFLTFGRW